jgi:hypothetical protein
MIDPVKELKDGYINLLTGAITYNGTTIPVYDEESDPAGNDFYIIVSSVTQTQLLNQKTYFWHECTIIIDVITRLDNRVTKMKEPSDVITAKILDIALPTLGETGVTLANFQAVVSRLESSQHLPVLDTDTKKVVRRVSRFFHSLVQLTA